MTVTFRQLRLTPLRDLVRGRITGRLDWRRAIDASDLPEPARATIRDVVRRTRLWRIERAAIAEELIAHFADALAAGESVDGAIAAFGDARAAARLIRRATIRKRSLAWHAIKWTRRAIGVLVLLYAIVLVRFVTSRPVVSVDYVARLNARAFATPEADRAWPLYRRAMLSLMPPGPNGQRQMDDTLSQWIPDANDPDGHSRMVVEAEPTDGEAWATLAAWLDAHADVLALLREGAARKEYGFVLGPGGSQDDPDLGWNDAPQRVDPSRPAIESSLISVLLPSLNHVRHFAQLLAADARLARSRGDGDRAAADLTAILNLARQVGDETPILVQSLVAIGVANLGFESIEQGLRDDGLRAMSDEQLVGLAHRVATYGGETAASLVDLGGERMMFHDIVQRTYSDDGHGDGRITAEGARGLPMVMGMTSGSGRHVEQAMAAVAITGVTVPLSSRRALLNEYDRLFALQEAALARPLRDPPPGPRAATTIDLRLAEIRESPLLTARYLPLVILMPSLNRVGVTAERALGRRDGIAVGIALELWRRRHGAYPETLDALVPAMLPRVPVDRITGGALRYRLVDGRPVVYSVGADRDDDGGRAPAGRDGKPEPWRAAEWAAPTPKAADGDWVVYDARPSRGP